MLPCHCADFLKKAVAVTAGLTAGYIRYGWSWRSCTIEKNRVSMRGHDCKLTHVKYCTTRTAGSKTGQPLNLRGIFSLDTSSVRGCVHRCRRRWLI